MEDSFPSLPVTIVSKDGREKGSLKYNENGAVVATLSELQSTTGD